MLEWYRLNNKLVGDAHIYEQDILAQPFHMDYLERILEAEAEVTGFRQGQWNTLRQDGGG